MVACVLLTLDVLVPEVFGQGKTKDYSLWYWAGQQILNGGDLYPKNVSDYFEFIYPPPAAILLALPSLFGPIPLYIFLCVVNAAAWWITSHLSNDMTGSGREPSPWIAAVPSFAMLTSIFDMFDLGQPNLLLLAMMLCGFWLMLKGRGWSAGALFALATAIKAFPVAVLPYLLWRRKWIPAASMAAFLVAFLIVLPAPIRGFDRNISELTNWYRGMVGSSSEQGFGQRPEQNWSWVNQSVIAITHRLVRPINYNQEDPNDPVEMMNIIDVDYKTANVIVAVVCGVIGLGFLWLMPPLARTTARSNAEEIAILFCLMTIASPLARQYYFIWLFFPVTVLVHRAAYDPRKGARLLSCGALALAAALMLLSLPFFPHLFQALGNNFAATMIIAATLGWHLRHPLDATLVTPERTMNVPELTQPAQA